MVQEVRCSNPACGRPSRFGCDELGRAFRCVRCGARLPRQIRGLASTRGLSLGLVSHDDAESDAPWEREQANQRGRSLGVALPSRVGPYRIQKEVASAGNARVFRAIAPEASGATRPRDLAVTVPHAVTVSSPMARSAFFSRSKALQELRHPGIIPVLDAGHDGNRPYLVTAPIEACSLADRLAQGGRFEPLEAARIVIALAEALHFAHERGVVHGELTTRCVLMGATGTPLLTGFPLEIPSALPEIDRSAPAPALAAIAPERLGRDQAPPDAAGDQYALGALFYELLCGRPAFDGPAWRMVDEILHDGPIPPRDWCPRLPKVLDRICLQAMARDPEARFASCLELAETLARWESRANTVDSVRRAARWARRRPAAVASAALTLVGVIATTVLATALLAATAVAPVPLLGPALDQDDPPAIAGGRDRS